MVSFGIFAVIDLIAFVYTRPYSLNIGNAELI